MEFMIKQVVNMPETNY